MTHLTTKILVNSEAKVCQNLCSELSYEDTKFSKKTMNFVWKEYQKQTPSLHKTLELVAREMYEKETLCIDICESKEINIQNAVNHNLLSQNDNEVFFADINILKGYLTYCAANHMLEIWSDTEELLRINTKNIRIGFRFNELKNIENEILLMLSYEYDKDLTEFIIKASSLRNTDSLERHFWSLYDSFWKIFPEISAEPQAAIAVVDVMREDYDKRSLQIHNSFKKFASSNLEIAREIYDLLLERADSSVANLLSCVLASINEFSVKEAHEKALNLLDRNKVILRKVGARALGPLSYEKIGSEKLLELTLNKLELLRSSNSIEVKQEIVIAYEYLVKHTERARSVFMDFVVDPDPLVWRTAFFSLCQLVQDFCSEKWYKQALKKLLGTQTFSAEEMSQVDYCIAKYVDREPLFSLQLIEVLAFRWYSSVQNSNQLLIESLSESFKGLLSSQHSLLADAFTGWIASNNQILHVLAFELNDYFSSVPVTVGNICEECEEPKLVLSKKTLDHINEQTIIYVLYRISGYVTNSASLCALLLSALQREPLSDNINSLVKTLLVSYVLFNAPIESGQYLNNFLKKKEISIIEKEVIEEALFQSNAYFENRNRLPKLKEFEPSTQKKYLYRILRQKRQKMISEKVEEGSLLRTLMPSVLFLYGKRTSAEQDGLYTDPVPFIEISTSTELSQGELIDPIGQYYLRVQWRYVGLLKIEENESEIDL